LRFLSIYTLRKRIRKKGRYREEIIIERRRKEVEGRKLRKRWENGKQINGIFLGSKYFLQDFVFKSLQCIFLASCINTIPINEKNGSILF
jgi:hypothetical protein